MTYPHRKYLIYLLSRQMKAWDIVEWCSRFGLTPPGEDMLRDLRLEVGISPSFWEEKYKISNTKFRRWLRDLGVEGFWKSAPEFIEAEKLCLTSELRRDIQALILLHRSDLDAVYDSLAAKYPESLLPSRPALTVFHEFFWDVGALSSQALWDFLKLQEDFEKYKAAAEGDSYTALALLGIRPTVSRKEFLRSVVAFTQQQIEAHRRQLSGKPASGNQLVGLSALARQGKEAVAELDELEGLGGQSDVLLEEAQKFKLRQLQSGQKILSIDELDKLDELLDQEDLESLASLEPEEEESGPLEEEMSNVRVFAKKA